MDLFDKLEAPGLQEKFRACFLAEEFPALELPELTRKDNKNLKLKTFKITEMQLNTIDYDFLISGEFDKAGGKKHVMTKVTPLYMETMRPSVGGFYVLFQDGHEGFAADDTLFGAV